MPLELVKDTPEDISAREEAAALHLEWVEDNVMMWAEQLNDFEPIYDAVFKHRAIGRGEAFSMWVANANAMEHSALLEQGIEATLAPRFKGTGRVPTSLSREQVITDLVNDLVLTHADSSLQPTPVPTEKSRSVTDAVVADLQYRREHGILKYGVELKSHNGRNPKIDKYQELLDAVMYAKQELMEDETHAE